MSPNISSKLTLVWYTRNVFLLVFVVATSIFINACTTLKSDSDSQGIRVEDEGLVIDPFYQIPGSPETPEKSPDSDQSEEARYSQPTTSSSHISSESTSQTVLALLNQAKLQEQTGNSERAAAVIERALRIEPNNAQLWHRLALLRLQQGKLALAESFAAKSSALARDDERLRRENNTIIEQARILQGKE